MKKYATERQIQYINDLIEDISPNIVDRIKILIRANKPLDELSMSAANRLIQTILHYRQTGLIEKKQTKAEKELSMDESLRNLRRKLRGKVDKSGE